MHEECLVWKEKEWECELKATGQTGSKATVIVKQVGINKEEAHSLSWDMVWGILRARLLCIDGWLEFLKIRRPWEFYQKHSLHQSSYL